VSAEGDDNGRSTGGAAYAFDLRSGRGFRAMAWQGGGRGVLLTIAAVLLFPVLLSGGLIALIIGAVFGVGWLTLVGAAMAALGGLAFLFLMWKLLSGLRGATRMFQGMSPGSARDDDDRIDGRWQ
jgi:hypothetical protein